MEKLKVSFCDKKFISEYFKYVGILFFLIEVLNWLRLEKLIPKIILENDIFIKISILVIMFTVLFIYVNLKKKEIFEINNVKILIKEGNIFNEKDLKVIAFNEYFDTLVDNNVIAESTLNGKFILEYVTNVRDLDRGIEEDPYLNKNNKNINTGRITGKKKKYTLGSIYKYNGEFLLTALTRFNDRNEAFLELKEYYLFLIKFWEEISRVYAGKPVSIPLLGSGITRFKGFEASSQDLLRMMLLTLKISRIRYASDITIVLSKEKIEEINLYHIKDLVN